MIRILHLSDIHLRNAENADTYRNQLEIDLKNELKINELKYLVISGDVGINSTPEEYSSAELMFIRFMDCFNIDKRRMIIVPGNHDLNWDFSENSYDFIPKRCVPENLSDGTYYSAGDAGTLVRNENAYRKRFNHFCEFYRKITGKTYPDNFKQQGIISLFPEKMLLFLGLNSAWEIDHFYKQRSSINTNSVDYALDQISRIDCDDWLKIAVCHHPVSGPEMMKNVDFLERLAVCGFQTVLHGHIHKAKQDYYHFDPKRQMHIIGSGTFGARAEEMASGIPLQYNLLLCDLERNEITVHTRKKENPEGSWSADSRWGDKNNPVPYYTIKLRKTEKVFCEPSRVKKIANKNIEALDLEIGSGYRQWVEDQCKHMNIDRLRDPGSSITISVPDFFIPLYTNIQIHKENKFKDDLELVLEREMEFNIEDLIAENDSILVEGKAGSGKTTLVKHMTYMMLREEYKGLSGWLPVLIFLKDLKDFNFGGRPKNADTAEQILEFYFTRNDCCLDIETVKGYISKDKALFFMDGFDEVDRDIRDALVHSFEGLRRKLVGGRICWVGRSHGIDGAILDVYGDRRIKILPFSEKQQETFIKRWHENIEGKLSKVGKKAAEKMTIEIRKNLGVMQLIGNPLMLTAICILYYDQKKLPVQRAELYRKFIDNMLHRRFNNPEKIYIFLMTLAREIHVNRRKGIDKQPALEIFIRVYFKGIKDEYGKYYENEFNRIESGCGLLKFEGGQLMFQHLTFQEYLTAAAIKNKERKYDKVIADFWNDEWYHAVIEFYIGLLSIDNPNWANYIVHDALNKPAGASYCQWLLAGRCFLDIHKDRRESEVIQLASIKMLKIINSKANPQTCSNAGEIIGWLGDYRDLETFIPIPGGTYRLSSSTLEIESFEMSKYLVTNQWYAKFINIGGYENDTFWTSEGSIWLNYTKAKAPRFWHSRIWNCPNSPVVGICWYEAHAFTCWLSSVSEDGYKYYLPNENQWEASASGFERRKYPWGNKWADGICNTLESKIGKTCAVGIFEESNTPEGISDLSGNVWEFTCSDYHTKSYMSDYYFDNNMTKLLDKYDKSLHEERERIRKLLFLKWNEKQRHLPVLKGGSWYRASNDACISARSKCCPDFRYGLVGLRCIRKKSLS